MISDENLAQIRALMVEVVTELLEAHGLKRLPSAAARRMRAYRERVTKRNGAITKRNAAPSAKRNGSVTALNGALPEWLPLNHWSTYLEMRTRLRKPASARAQRMLIGRLSELKDKGFNPTQILAQAELNCWLSFYEPKP